MTEIEFLDNKTIQIEKGVDVLESSWEPTCYYCTHARSESDSGYVCHDCRTQYECGRYTSLRRIVRESLMEILSILEVQRTKMQ